MRQPVISRIETGKERPRLDTLDGLLDACGFRLSLAPRVEGIDRTAIRQLLRLTPLERLEHAVTEARNLEGLRNLADVEDGAR